MRLWTVQSSSAFIALNRDGVLYCDSPRTADHLDDGESDMFRRAYDWMMDQMEKRIPAPRPKDAQFPLWAWAQVGSYKKEYHPFGHVYTHGKSVLLELDVPDDQVLLSDYDIWYCVANRWSTYLDPLMERKLKHYQDEHVTAGFDDLPKELKDYVTSSWERAFDLNNRDKAFPNMKRNRMIQATLWQIRTEWVKGYQVL